MANFCLPKFATDSFKSKLVDGSFDPQKLAEMTSEERHKVFSDVVGESNAKGVNALFESKLLLKNQQSGMISWAKSVAGLKPEVLTDMVSKIQRLDKILSPADEQHFLADLASQKIGVGVTHAEAIKITELSKKIAETEPNTRANGLARLDLQDYVESLKPGNKNLISNIANIPKTVMTTLDFSAALRQGWGMISRPEFYKALPEMFKYAFNKDNFRNLQADIISDPMYDTAKKSGLRISILANKLSGREENYMSTLLNKVPGVEGSEHAYAGFLSKVRFDVFKKLIQKANLAGEDIRPGQQATKDIANVVNDFTGSGNLGKGDKYSAAVPALNATLFSPRKISATINMFNPERYLNPNISQTARVAALRNLIGSVGATTLVLGLAKLGGNKVETNPDSSDFGKVVNGNTRYEVTGGNSTYITLLARLLTNKTESSTTNKITELGKGYKPETRASVATKFARNKLSPWGSMVADWFYGTDSDYVPFSITKEIKDRITPLIISDVQKLIQNDPTNTIVGTLGDIFGVGIQTYTNTKSKPKSGTNIIQDVFHTLFGAKTAGAEPVPPGYKKPITNPNELTVDRLKAEIAFRESGDATTTPYQTVNNSNSNGIPDYGKYQVNADTLKTYSKPFLGKQVTPKEFLASADLQEKFMEQALEHIKSLGAKSLDTYLILYHHGWGNVSTQRITELKNTSEIKKYLYNTRSS